MATTPSAVHAARFPSARFNSEFKQNVLFSLALTRRSKYVRLIEKYSRSGQRLAISYFTFYYTQFCVVLSVMESVTSTLGYFMCTLLLCWRCCWWLLSTRQWWSSLKVPIQGFQVRASHWVMLRLYWSLYGGRSWASLISTGSLPLQVIN